MKWRWHGLCCFLQRNFGSWKNQRKYWLLLRKRSCWGLPPCPRLSPAATMGQLRHVTAILLALICEGGSGPGRGLGFGLHPPKPDPPTPSSAFFPPLCTSHVILPASSRVLWALQAGEPNRIGEPNCTPIRDKFHRQHWSSPLCKHA